MKILVIDDEPVELRLLGAVLSAGGNAVSQAPSAERALEGIARERPDLVIVDLHMPGIDGLALTRAIKSNPLTEDIPVVAMTAVPELYSKARAIEAGCDAFLTKPLSVMNLSADLQEMVPLGGPRRGSPSPEPPDA